MFSSPITSGSVSTGSTSFPLPFTSPITSSSSSVGPASSVSKVSIIHFNGMIITGSGVLLFPVDHLTIFMIIAVFATK